LARFRSFFHVVPVISLTFAFAVSGCNVFFPSGEKEQVPYMPGLVIHPVRANSVGYISDLEKRVTIVLPAGMTSLRDTTAEVRDASDNVVWTCTVTGPMSDASTGATVYVGDFTPFTDTGTFYIQVPGLMTSSGPAKSVTFPIGPSVFRTVLTHAMAGMYGWRCGTGVNINLDSQHWSHAACHGNDASQKFLDNVLMDTIKPSLHGWHDAGDYGKYTTNGAFTAGMMLQAFERFKPMLSALNLPIPESGGDLPDYLDEVKWELDWLLTTQGDDGSVSFKVTAMGFEQLNVLPEQDGQRRYYTPVSTHATADFVAVFAQASRIYGAYKPELGDQYLAAARKSYDFLKANGLINPDLSQFSTGSYDSTGGDSGNRAWAAAEMWETTGEDTFLADFEGPNKTPKSIPDNFDWDNVSPLGSFTYLLSQRPGRDQAMVDAMTAAMLKSADNLAARADAAAFGRSISNYWWGSNGAVARTSMNLWTAAVLNPTDAPRYSSAIAMQLDHLLGRNIYDRTQVTGVGYHPPLQPHHRPSINDNTGNPWPGLMVGGANPDADTSLPPGATWKDSSEAYDLNEVAINWNGALIFAAAALTPPL
jgi:endoglucanase